MNWFDVGNEKDKNGAQCATSNSRKTIQPTVGFSHTFRPPASVQVPRPGPIPKEQCHITCRHGVHPDMISDAVRLGSCPDHYTKDDSQHIAFTKALEPLRDILVLFDSPICELKTEDTFSAAFIHVRGQHVTRLRGDTIHVAQSIPCSKCAVAATAPWCHCLTYFECSLGPHETCPRRNSASAFRSAGSRQARSFVECPPPQVLAAKSS